MAERGGRFSVQKPVVLHLEGSRCNRQTGRGLGALQQTCVITSSLLEALYITRSASAAFICSSVCLERCNVKPEP